MADLTEFGAKLEYTALYLKLPEILSDIMPRKFNILCVTKFCSISYAWYVSTNILRSVTFMNVIMELYGKLIGGINPSWVMTS